MFDRELHAIATELTPAFTCVTPPRRTTPLVFSSPHSGRTYPKAFREAAILDPLTLRKSEDAFVDLLLEDIPASGAPLLAARFPRAYLDVNRDPDELDAALIDGPLPTAANTQSSRVLSGLGVIPRVVADGEPIYAGKIPWAVVELRLSRLYQPFHNALSALLQEAIDHYGAAVLVDCHSMPSTASGQSQARRPHFIIGDRFGSSCDPRLTQAVSRFLSGEGFDVQLNRPYAGGFITEHYGRPSTRVHALQIEINRGLYLDEERIAPSPQFHAVRSTLARLSQHLVAVTPAILDLPPPVALAAE